MRKFIILSSIFTLFFVIEAFAQVNFNFNAVGVQAGYVKPEDPIESTIGFGARAELGTLMKENVSMGAIVDYWSKKYGEGTGVEVTFSQMLLAPYVHYNFATQGSFVPYAGGGVGLAFNSSKVEYTNSFYGLSGSSSTSDTDFVIFGVGGAKMNFNEKMAGFAEARYLIGDVDALSIVVGFLYSLH